MQPRWTTRYAAMPAVQRFYVHVDLLTLTLDRLTKAYLRLPLSSVCRVHDIYWPHDLNLCPFNSTSSWYVVRRGCYITTEIEDGMIFHLSFMTRFVPGLWGVRCAWGVRFMRCGDLDLWPKIVLLITLAMDSAHTRLEHSATFYSWVIAPMAHTDGRK